MVFIQHASNYIDYLFLLTRSPLNLEKLEKWQYPMNFVILNNYK